MGGGRRTNSRRKAAPPTEIDAIQDELLELVFLRLPSHLHLVRAACACRRWRRVIAGDDGRVLRRFASLHGASSARVAGRYRVDGRHHHPRPPGCNPVFVPSSSPWARPVAARKLALDFLPRGQFGDCRWELVDSRSGFLLLLDEEFPRLLICDPLTRRYRVLPHSAWFHGCEFLGAFLLDGDGDADAGTRFSMSNFRVTCAVYRDGQPIVRACAFSSARGGRWTSVAGRSSTAHNGLVAHVYFAGSADGFAYWTDGNNIVFTLDKDAAEFTSSVLPDDGEYATLRNKRQATEYAYQQPWPPTIEACLS